MKQKEIGSEFWDIPIGSEKNGVFPNTAKWFISGTAALQYILLDIRSKHDIRTAALPSWCCSCMIEPFLQQGVEVRFYPVYWNAIDGLVCDYRPVEGCDLSLKLNYFGYSRKKIIGRPTGIQIRDLTHSVFSDSPKDAQYYFGSLRKWAGFYTGGYAWGNWNQDHFVKDADPAYMGLRQNAMENKWHYLIGKSHSKDYLKQFSAAEEYLDHCSIQGSCERDIKAAEVLNVDEIRKKRRENAGVLLEAVHDIAMFPSIEQDDCPLFVPIVVPEGKRTTLRRFLIEQEIYCPVHWPVEEVHQLDSLTLPLYEQELSLVCDQRYTVRDMERIVQALDRFQKTR